mmetsp:Transcript_56315/g.180803  ORF Transcript_56315/g.180803 Transcript_56315/m.180803 type:complete len:600 (-) Transcript_56315:55-1854(-)
MAYRRVAALLLFEGSFAGVPAAAEKAAPGPASAPEPRPQQGFLHGFEASGNFRHVAGSACCHPQTDPRPASVPGTCEQRCSRQATCDAFVFAPSERLCFLLRYVERGRDGGPLATPTRPAADRVFGLARREGRSGASGAGAADAEARCSGGSAQADQGCESARGKGGERVEFIFEADCEECEEEAGRAHGRTREKGGRAQAKDWEEILRQAFGGARGATGSKRAKSGPGSMEFEYCDVMHESSDSCAGEQFTCFEQGQWEDMFQRGFAAGNASGWGAAFEQCASDQENVEWWFDEQCDCADAEEWQQQFRRAHQSVWPNRKACLDECTTECKADLKETQREQLKFIKKLLKRLFGKGVQLEDVYDAGADEEEAAFCQDTCRGICDDFGQGMAPGHGNGTRATAVRGSGRPAEVHASPADAMEAAVQRATRVLSEALDRAGAQIRRAGPQLLDAPVPGLEGLLGDGTGVEQLGLGPAALLGADEDVDLHASGLPELFIGSQESDDLAMLFDGAEDEQPSADMLSPFGGNSDGEETLAWPVQGAAQQWPSLGLMPSRASLFQGVPAAARWAEGSPPFLQRLFDRASARLNMLLPVAVKAVR